MAGHGFIGIWEVISCGYSNGTCCDNQDLKGIRFRLDESGDVTWTVPEELKNVPLFACETYEIYSTSVLDVVIRLGAYEGHVLEFQTDEIDPGETVVLTCKGLCIVHCKRINEDTLESNHNIPFSLLPALESGYFSDLLLTSSNKKQFNVHLSILHLQGIDLAWNDNPAPFSNLSEDGLGTILHFLYTECLPENLTEATARVVINAATPYPCMNNLVHLCKMYLKNTALKDEIIELVNEMHMYMNQIIEHFNTRNNPIDTENIYAFLEKLCFIVKQSIRDAVVVGAKLLLLCDLFTKRKDELTRSERHEIIRYAKSRLPIFLTQLTKFLQAVKNTFSSMMPFPRLEMAKFLVPEIEIILDTLSRLAKLFEKGLLQIIQDLSPSDVERNKSGVGDLLGKSLRRVLHIRELRKLKCIHEHISSSVRLLVQHKEQFSEMSPSQKLRSMVINLDQIIEELPIFLRRLDEVMAAFDEELEWREFKFCFKVGTSKVSAVLNKLVLHCDTLQLQDVMLQLCELVQRDAFTQSMQSLGLLDASSSTVNNSSDSQKMPQASLLSTPKHHHEFKLNLVESLCIPPSSTKGNLSKLCLQLFKNQRNTDMEFEIIGSSDSDSTSEEICIIPAHRVIVAARCDWFRRALLSGMREAIDKKIVIHDTSPVLFRIFLEYLYSGRLKQINYTTEQLVELLLLSDRYEVDSLKQTTETSLQASIDYESALYFLSMADQYNANILKNACLNFISHHHELTENEVFFELPISLQAEIFDCVWTHPVLHKSVTLDKLLPTSSNTEPSGYSENCASDLAIAVGALSSESRSSSFEDLRLPHNNGRLDSCVNQIRDIVGDSAPRELLIQVILAADYDLCRAVNYYYLRCNDE